MMCYNVLPCLYAQWSLEEMPKTTHLSLRVTPELTREIDALASALDRPKSWVVEKAVEAYLETQRWQIEAIEVGVAAAKAGDLVSDKAVQAWIESWGSAKEKPMPRSRRR
jgi:predicted transcriptional regulator